MTPPTPAVLHRPGKPRRWHRVAIPFLVLGLIYLITGGTHLVEEPDLGDPGTLSPTGAGPDGSSRLAEMLAGKGVTLRRVTSSTDALRAAEAHPNATIFVPAPDLLSPAFFVGLLENLHGYRLVLVRPGRRSGPGLGFASGSARWAARTVPPECGADFASAAGPATVLRSSYQTDPDLVTTDCYRGGLVGWRLENSEVLAVGATDPFRNSRIGEAGNAALGTALLGRDRDVIWVDVHKAEPSPKVPPPKFSLPRYHQPNRDSGGTDPTWQAFPPELWASLALLFVLGVLIATVRGRRLGPPVAEPLPVVVPATETVTGRGRLYHRIRSRQESLDVLRAAALRRMTPALDPYGARPSAGGAGSDDEMIEQVATRTGVPAAEVRAILRGPTPQSDNEFGSAVAQLDALVDAVLRVGPRPTDTRGPVNPGGEL